MRTIRISLGVLLAIICVNAIGGGFYGMAGAKDIPVEWLQGSPFTSYFIPALFLFVVIGGISCTGAIMAFKNSKYTRTVAFICSILLITWIFIQLRVIGYMSWLQPAITVCAMIIFGLGYFLPGTQAHSKT